MLAVDDGRVVRDAGDGARLVGHHRAGGQAGGDCFYAGLNISPARVYQFGTEVPAAGTKAIGSIPHRLVGAVLI